MPDIDIQFIGTSSATPSADRGLSSILVTLGDKYTYLIDCGEGTSRQMIQAGVDFSKLSGIFITHSHVDHYWGLSGVVWKCSNSKLEKLPIYGSPKTIAALRRILVDTKVMGMAMMNLEVTFNPMPVRTPIYVDQYSISAFPTPHTEGSYGYIFEQPPSRILRQEVIDFLDLDTGPLLDRLLSGQDITLDDGTLVKADEALDPPFDPIKLVLMGDCDGGKLDARLMEDVRGADCLVTEATYLPHETERARGSNHSTMAEAAQFGLNAEAKALILTHITSRNTEERGMYMVAVDDLNYTHPNVVIAQDFDQFNLSPSGLYQFQRSTETEGFDF